MKTKNKKFKVPAYVSRDIGVMVEDFKGTLDLVMEQTAEIPKIKKSMEVMHEDIEAVKIDIEFIRGDVEVIKTDIEQIKHDLKSKIDRSEFAVLERRVALLESRR